MGTDLAVRAVGAADHAVVGALMREAWGTMVVARRGEAVDVTGLAGFVARLDGADVGLALVAAREDEYEVVAISTQVEGRGVGRALLETCIQEARARGCRRLWLSTTNNNVRALAFYQRNGLDLCAFRRDGVAESRKVKPSIPLVDPTGCPIAHELELELVLPPPPGASRPGGRVGEPV
jgi:ribosomal protein S18 acetylase RimI-like enzyme